MTREYVIFQYKKPTTSIIIITEENKNIGNDKTKINIIVGVHNIYTNDYST